MRNFDRIIIMTLSITVLINSLSLIHQGRHLQRLSKHVLDMTDSYQKGLEGLQVAMLHLADSLGSLMSYRRNPDA